MLDKLKPATTWIVLREDVAQRTEAVSREEAGNAEKHGGVIHLYTMYIYTIYIHVYTNM